MFYIKGVLNFKCLTPSTKDSVHSNSVTTGGRGDFEQRLQWAEDGICLTYDIFLVPKLQIITELGDSLLLGFLLGFVPTKLHFYKQP
jgi:hypothetical protein